MLIGATEPSPTLQGWVTRLAVAANLAALIWYKYAVWLVGLLAGDGCLQLRVRGVDALLLLLTLHVHAHLRR